MMEIEEIEAFYGELLACLENDKQELKEEKADLERKNNRLEQEKEICEDQVSGLEQEREVCENQVSGLDQEVRNLREQLNCSRSQPENQEIYLDISEYRFAIISGHEDAANRIIRELRAKHHISRIEFIDNSTAERRRNLRPRLENVDFVLLQTKYLSHAATKSAEDCCRGYLVILPDRANARLLGQYIEAAVKIKVLQNRLDELER